MSFYDRSPADPACAPGGPRPSFPRRGNPGPATARPAPCLAALARAARPELRKFALHAIGGSMTSALIGNLAEKGAIIFFVFLIVSDFFQA